MSSNRYEPDDNGALAQVWQRLYAASCCDMAVGALVIYEHFITFPQEVRLIWRLRLSSGTVIFLANRYFVLLYAIFSIMGVFNWTSALSCEVVQMMTLVPQLSLYAIIPVFLSLHAHAISGYNWYTTTVILSLGLGPLAANIFFWDRTSHATVTYVASHPVCDFEPAYSNHTYHIALTMTRLSVVAADTLVLAITWRHTYRLKKEASSAYITFPFLALLLEHGVVFFLLLTSLNLMQICTQLISPPEIDSTNLADLVSVFIIPTSSILISRKILHLRNVIDVHDLSPDEFQDPEYSDPLQSLSFTTASNLEDDADAYEHGEPLDSATQARGYDGIPLDYLKDCSSTVCGIGD